MTDDKQVSLPGFSHVSKNLPKVKKPDANFNRLLDKSELIEQGELGSILYQHSLFCQIGMPYRDPGPNTLIWDRTEGRAALRIKSGDIFDPRTGKWEVAGLPFGPKPRLILCYLNAQAIKTQSQEIEIEDSLSAFIRRIGFPSKGKNFHSIKNHLGRLSSADIKFFFLKDSDDSNLLKGRQEEPKIIDGFELWFPKNENQRVFWPSTVTLGESYFNSLMNHAVPLSEHAISALRNNALGLDMYCWLAQRLHRVNPALPVRPVPWPYLQNQFGQDYSRLRDFKRVFKGMAARVRLVYPDARFKITNQGIFLYHSAPPIPKKLILIPKK